MKKLLIIGASILQLPAIKKAKELGYYVGVVDYNPQAIGIKYADDYFEVSTIDIDGVKQVAKQFQPDGIMTLATDMPMRTIAEATTVCGLPGIDMETAIKATDKGEMMKAFAQHNVEHPWYYVALDYEQFERIKNRILYPCIMKPVDNAGSRGVVLVHSLTELETQYAYTVHESRHGGVIIEEYMEGNEVSVEVMVIDGLPKVLQITDKITTGAPHFVEMGHTQPSRLKREDILKINDLAERAVLAVGISNGPAHVEIKLTKDGPKMIELGARMGGDCITSHLVPLSTGIDMIASTIKLACGERIDVNTQFNKGSAIRYLNADAGIIKSIKNIDKVRRMNGICEVTLLKNIGDKVSAIESSLDRIGYVITQADDAEQAAKICDKAINMIKVEVE